MTGRQQVLVGSYLKEYDRDVVADVRPTHTSRLVKVLSDGLWHDGGELARAVGWRFGGYLHDLKKRGLRWESERSSENSNVWYYRLALDDESEGGEN